MATEVTYCFDKETSDFEHITIKGHANYADKGRDIVCAAISAITNGTINFLHQNYPHDGKISCLPTQISIYAPKHNPKYQLCLKLMIYQLENIANHYPRYIKVKTKRKKKRV